jgi:hypothetical protein
MVAALSTGLPELLKPFDVDPGWESRAYPVRFVLPCPELSEGQAISTSCFDSRRQPALGEIGWLADRMALRYRIGHTDARRIAKQYSVGFHDGDADMLRAHKELDAAWREHILWTHLYHRDCNLLHGNYLHRRGSNESHVVKIAA